MAVNNMQTEPDSNNELINDFRSHAIPACRVLGLDTSTTETKLLDICERYVEDRIEEINAARVSEVWQQLGELTRGSTKNVSKKIKDLKEPTVVALLGGFPFAATRLSEVGFGDRTTGLFEINERQIFVPADDDEIERQEMKNAIDESGSGFVYRKRLPDFVELTCLQSDVKALSSLVDAVSDTILHRVLPDYLRLELAHCFASPIIRIFEMAEPQTLSKFVSELEEAKDKVPALLAFANTGAMTVLDQLSSTEAPKEFSRLVTAMLKDLASKGDAGFHKAFLQHIAVSDFNAFRIAVDEIRLRLELQYEKIANPTALGRRLTRDYKAYAGWKLVCDVLDVAWEPGMGPLGKDEKEPVSNLVHATFNHGESLFHKRLDGALARHAARTNHVSGIGNNGGSGELKLFNESHIKEIASLRNAIWQLDHVLKRLCDRLFAAKKPRSKRGLPKREKMARLEVTVLALRTWRRNLNIRLHRGIYIQKKRDDDLSFPRFPQVPIHLSDDVREERIVSAAEPLIEEIYSRRRKAKSEAKARDQEIESLRNAISQLDHVLARLSQPKWAAKKRLSRGSHSKQLEIAQFENKALALRIWRRALNVRLRRVAYMQKIGGDPAWLPRFPKITDNLSDDAQDEKITLAAEPILAEMRLRRARDRNLATAP